MYQRWFRLDQLPFRLAPDPRFLFLTGNNATVYETLRRMATAGGLVELIGEHGLGKTLFLDSLAATLPEHDIVRIVWPDLTGGELLGALHSHYRLPEWRGHSTKRLGVLAEYFRDTQNEGRRRAMLVDETHQLTQSALQDLFEIASMPGAPTVFAAGRCKLPPQIEPIGPPAGSLPVANTLFLNRLKPAQTRAYIVHRLAVAGAPGSEDLFEPKSITEIQRYSGGTPRLINILCDSSMCVAAERQGACVSLFDVSQAVRELRWTEFTPLPAAGSLAQTPSAGIPDLRRELIVTYKSVPYAHVELQRGKMIAGRSPDCGLHLENNFVSREHFEIVTSAEGCFVKDLGSTNGILINGLRMRLQQLQHDDVVDIAEFRLRYQETPRREALAAPPTVSKTATPKSGSAARPLGDTEVHPAIASPSKRQKHRRKSKKKR